QEQAGKFDQGFGQCFFDVRVDPGKLHVGGDDQPDESGCQHDGLGFAQVDVLFEYDQAVSDDEKGQRQKTGPCCCKTCVGIGGGGKQGRQTAAQHRGCRRDSPIDGHVLHLQGNKQQPSINGPNGGWAPNQ